MAQPQNLGRKLVLLQLKQFFERHCNAASILLRVEHASAAARLPVVPSALGLRMLHSAVPLLLLPLPLCLGLLRLRELS